MFGFVVMKKKTYEAGEKLRARVLARAMMEADEKLRAVTADRDAANMQIARLLHNSIEVTLLWAAVQECGVDKRVRVVYDRLVPKAKG